ncbi:GIY-YIG nuclease family protein [Nostoc calcicola FACHB-3891]|nr:GIY-YIG nuclease family protein [Nostoc calcicola FACHB-3891]
MSVEVVNPLTLPSLSLQERRSLPECAAVYFVLNGNEILYIGGTVNLAQRWLAHHRWHQLVEMGDGIRLAWLECSEPALLLEVETALIKHFQPRLNRTPVLGDNGKVILQTDVKESTRTRLKLEAVRLGTTMSLLTEQILDEALKKLEQQEVQK